MFQHDDILSIRSTIRVVFFSCLAEPPQLWELNFGNSIFAQDTFAFFAHSSDIEYEHHVSRYVHALFLFRDHRGHHDRCAGSKLMCIALCVILLCLYSADGHNMVPIPLVLCVHTQSLGQVPLLFSTILHVVIFLCSSPLALPVVLVDTEGVRC